MPSRPTTNRRSDPSPAFVTAVGLVKPAATCSTARASGPEASGGWEAAASDGLGDALGEGSGELEGDSDGLGDALMHEASSTTPPASTASEFRVGRRTDRCTMGHTAYPLGWGRVRRPMTTTRASLRRLAAVRDPAADVIGTAHTIVIERVEP